MWRRKGLPISSFLSAWRAMTPDDLTAVMAVADQVHPDFPEDLAVFAERQRLYLAGAYVLERDEGICGYLLSHPWHSGKPPALNVLLGGIPPNADTFYIHDLALLPSVRGSGMAGAIINQIAAHARAHGFPTMRLIAVNDSIPFWQRFGFLVDKSAEALEHTRSYDAAAREMFRMLI